MRIERYAPTLAQEWDKLVGESRNGTFLHRRGYMEYHSARFTDCSLLFYRGNEPVALLPAHIKDGCFCSHNGLTYGGLLMGKGVTAEEVLEMFTLLQEFILSETTAKKLIYKPTPHIYHNYPCEEDLYALFRNNARLSERKISSALPLGSPIPIGGRRKLTDAAKSRLRITEESDFTAFWSILQERLHSKYGVSPVHSLQEITLLKQRFPQNIILTCVTDSNGNILGGTVLFVTDRVVHMQYSATTDEGRRVSALDHLYEYLIDKRFTDKAFFDFGVSVEEGGRYLNSGLIAYKERLGGRAVVYDTYVIDLKERGK